MGSQDWCFRHGARPVLRPYHSDQLQRRVFGAREKKETEANKKNADAVPNAAWYTLALHYSTVLGSSHAEMHDTTNKGGSN